MPGDLRPHLGRCGAAQDVARVQRSAQAQAGIWKNISNPCEKTSYGLPQKICCCNAAPRGHEFCGHSHAVNHQVPPVEINPSFADRVGRGWLCHRCGFSFDGELNISCSGSCRTTNSRRRVSIYVYLCFPACHLVNSLFVAQNLNFSKHKYDPNTSHFFYVRFSPLLREASPKTGPSVCKFEKSVFGYLPDKAV